MFVPSKFFFRSLVQNYIFFSISQNIVLFKRGILPFMKSRWITVVILIALLSCNSNHEKKVTNESITPSQTIEVPAFNSDSAYYFVKRQVDFGPRVPNTPAHREAGDFIIETLKQYGAQVSVQEFEHENYEGKKLQLRNIIASFNPSQQKRILLAAHWDTRPFADKDENPDAPFDGANDGASGVAILLELARLFKEHGSPAVGVDIILFDGEDWGEKEGSQGTHLKPDGLEEWWCLGSQYWSANKHKSNYVAYYGILLDMVGAKNAQFHREGYSMFYAPNVVEKVWSTAAQLGYASRFVKKNQPSIIDDHLFVNKLAKIPMIDIVHYDPAFGYFGDFHHTQKDNLDLISKETLNMVGETLLHVIYQEPVPRALP